MIGRLPSRSAVVTIVGLLVVLAPAGVVLADAAAPTDYESTVVSVTPPTATIDVEVIGGDSFVQLTVAPGTEVLIEGYQQEPYLRFRTDGVVEENQRAPTTYLNASRLGGGDVPAGADPALPPDWKQVATGGTFAWHDHRSHWMNPDPPATATPGDVIQSSSLAMTVDAVPVEVTFSVTWLPAPSRLPLAVGAAVGGALILLAMFWRRRLAWPLLVVALAALGIGWWQFSSLPTATGPLLVWWLLPAIAAASVLIALVLGRRLVSYGLVLLAALELAAWIFVRRDGAFRALIPTDAPFWLDRGVMAATAVVTVAAAIGATVAMWRIPAAD
ncbi:MAG: hypothetical protein ABWZ99_16955 [Ilumatobacteraceae bacterium]